PQWLWLLALVPVLAIASLRAMRSLEPWRRYTAIAMRSAVIAALALVLAQMQFVRRNHSVATIFLLDRSRSVPEEQRIAAEAYVKNVSRQARADDRVGVIGFDGEAEVDLVPSRGGADLITFGMAIEPDRTDLAAA